MISKEATKFSWRIEKKNSENNDTPKRDPDNEK